MKIFYLFSVVISIECWLLMACKLALDNRFWCSIEDQFIWLDKALGKFYIPFCILLVSLTIGLPFLNLIFDAILIRCLFIKEL